MSFLLLSALLPLITATTTTNPHKHVSHLSVPLPQHVLRDSLATFVVNTTSITDLDDTFVRASWGNVIFSNPHDWIGVFPCPDKHCDELVFDHAPVQYKYLSKDRRSKPTPTGSTTFRLQLHPGVSAFRLVYVTGDAQYPSVLAESEVISFSSALAQRPMHVRLSAVNVEPRDGAHDAFPGLRGAWRGGHPFPTKWTSGVGHAGAQSSTDPSKMRVMWAQNSLACSHAPRVKYGVARGEYTSSAVATMAFNYTVGDMCDHHMLPAARQGWFNQGVQLEAVLHDLTPRRVYYYIVGDDLHGWSPEKSFRASPSISGDERTSIVAFGDMGQSWNDQDGSLQHSWDYADHGEIHAPNTTNVARDLVSNAGASLVLHFGDISYAVGYESEWDTFLQQIEPVASRVPWMTAIGNHEELWTGSFIQGSDSGGECGVPYTARFPFATLNYLTPQQAHVCAPHGDDLDHRAWLNAPWRKQQWYSFDHGSVHITVMSTEHDYAPGSQQYAFLKRDLQRVDRSKTPWVLFTGHRPMYIDSNFEGDDDTANTLQRDIEPLLLDHHVDIAFWGHHHSYQRTCAVKQGACVPSSEGVVHVVAGSAGYDHSHASKKPHEMFRVVNTKDWGVCLLDFQSPGKLTVTFVTDKQGIVADEFEIERESYTQASLGHHVHE